MFATSVLLASFAVTSMPQASALTKSTWFENISTASYGNSVVCGDHVCAPGEHSKWLNAVWQSQKVSYGKVGSSVHGEDVIDTLAGSNPMSTTSMESTNMTGNTMMPTNGTMESMNMTGKTMMPTNGAMESANMTGNKMMPANGTK